MQFALLLLSATNQLYLIGENGNRTIMRKINLISEYFLLRFFIAKIFFSHNQKLNFVGSCQKGLLILFKIPLSWKNFVHIFLNILCFQKKCEEKFENSFQFNMKAWPLTAGSNYIFNKFNIWSLSWIFVNHTTKRVLNRVS